MEGGDVSMSNIDERIVEMTFKGTTFALGIKQAVQDMTSLKNGLNGLKGSESDINNLDQAGKRFSLKGMADGISGLAGKFKALSIVGVTALATLANKAVNAGISILKSLTIDPIKAGLDVYETKINAIKTILANTTAAGTTLKQVTAALQQLNVYANQTVYNFGQMAKNIGTFTAAGVGLNQAVASIKGIANLAALSGSSAEQASGAMYQLSQAIASGSVKLQDWNSVVNAGIGGKVFQNALITTARAFGINVDAMIKKAGSFRQSLQDGWISAKVLTTTLATFTGDLSDKQLRAMGFTAAETAAIQKQAKIAVQSATQIRTISQLTQALKEEVATAWAAVFQAIIGNIGQATSTLSKLHTAAENFLTKPIYTFAKILQTFTDMGGRAIVIKGITNLLHSLGDILHVVGQAFRTVFPTTASGASSGLLTMAKGFERLTAALTPSASTLDHLRSIFEGLFSVVKIVFDVVSGLVKVIFNLGGAAAQGSGGFLSLLARLGDFVTNVRKSIESGTALATFFHVLATVLEFPIHIIDAIINKIGGMGGAFGKATGGLSAFVQKIGDFFKNIGNFILKGIDTGQFSALASLLNHLLIGSILLTVKHFFSGFAAASGGGAGVFATIKESLEKLTNTFSVFQDKLKSDILEKIAIAIGILAVSLLLLSFIKPAALATAVGAITVMMTELIFAMKFMVKFTEAGGIVKMIAAAAAIDLLAVALLILSAAVTVLAHLSWEQLAKGLSAVAVLLGSLVVTTKLLSTDAKGLIASSIAIGIMAVSLLILSEAVSKLGRIPTANLIKGVIAVAALLAIMAGFNAISGAQLIGTAVAMVIIGAALIVISKAVATLGALSIGTLAKGLLAITIALSVIAGALGLLTGALPGAAALVVVSAALVIMSKALTTLGGMSWGEIAKALITLALSLTIIAAAMIAMTEALPGAAALLVVAAALSVLTPVLIALGGLSWTSILKGLVTLAAVFVLLGVAGVVLGPLVPVLIGIGLAVTLLGVGLAAAGAGVFLFATGLATLGAAVTVSGVAILSFVKSILTIIPVAATEIGLGIIALAKAISGGAVAIENAFVAILTAILKGIIKVSPLAGQAFEALMVVILKDVKKYSGPITTTFLNLLQTLLNGIQSHLPRFVQSGVNILVGLLHGIQNNMDRVVTAGANVVISFINAIGNNTQRIVAAGVNMVINLINGIANKLRTSGSQLGSASRNLGSAMISGMIQGVLGGLSGLIGSVINAAKSALSAGLHAIGANSPSREFMKIGRFAMQGWAKGNVDNQHLVTDSVHKAGKAALETLTKTMSTVGSIIGDNIDLQPRITPVIDLTNAKVGFSQLAALSKKQLINAGVSSTSAASISAANKVAAAQANLIKTQQTNLTFNQTNNSPVALSTIDIYRRTKNQLSSVRGVLVGNANTG
jgi:tape measure domain-containing protein